MIEFGKARSWLGLTQVEAADLLGVSERTVSRWENGALIKPQKWQIYLQMMFLKVASQNGVNLTFSDSTVKLVDKDGEAFFDFNNESEMILMSIRIRGIN